MASLSPVNWGTLVGPSTRVRLTELRVRASVVVPSMTAPVLLLTVRYVTVNLRYAVMRKHVLTRLGVQSSALQKLGNTLEHGTE